jgi:hypothetical protein
VKTFPAPGQRYGAAGWGGGGGGGSHIDIFRLLSADISAKAVTLSASPSAPLSVLCFVAGNTPQRSGIDFGISGTTLSWAGDSLDGVLEVGDILQVVYV